MDLVLRYGEGQVGIVVTDDGRGFDAAGAEREVEAARGAASGGQDGASGGAGDGGFGLRGMAARVAEIGGAMSVVSTPGAGTSVEVKVPLDGSAERRTTATAATARDEERCA